MLLFIHSFIHSSLPWIYNVVKLLINVCVAHVFIFCLFGFNFLQQLHRFVRATVKSFWVLWNTKLCNWNVKWNRHHPLNHFTGHSIRQENRPSFNRNFTQANQVGRDWITHQHRTLTTEQYHVGVKMSSGHKKRHACSKLLLQVRATSRKKLRFWLNEIQLTKFLLRFIHQQSNSNSIFIFFSHFIHSRYQVDRLHCKTVRCQINR